MRRLSASLNPVSEVIMHSAIDSSVATTVNLGGADYIGLESQSLQSANNPATIALQPRQHLTHENSMGFQQALEEALELAGESVIVDLLWLEDIDSNGVMALVAAAEKAVALGKILSFQSMNYQVRLAVESEWERQRQTRFGSWSDRFDSNLEKFLGKGRRG